MADGASHPISEARTARPWLGQALGARTRLWAACRCGRETPIDPRPWLGQGLRHHATTDLEDRLRCVCGARRVRLEIRSGADAPGRDLGGIYVFR